MFLSGETLLSPQKWSSIAPSLSVTLSTGEVLSELPLCDHPAPLSTAGGTQTYFCLTELTAQEVWD